MSYINNAATLAGYLNPTNFTCDELLERVFTKIDLCAQFPSAIRGIFEGLYAGDFARWLVNKFGNGEQITDSAIVDFYMIVEHLDAAYQKVLLCTVLKMSNDMIKLKIIHTMFQKNIFHGSVVKVYNKLCAKFIQGPRPRKLDKVLHKVQTTYQMAQSAY
jgi:hypothetical protein